MIGNYENVVIIKHAETVTNFCSEYNRMWDKITINMKNSNQDKIVNVINKAEVFLGNVPKGTTVGKFNCDTGAVLKTRDDLSVLGLFLK